jgi:hypothetical protein
MAGWSFTAHRRAPGFHATLGAQGAICEPPAPYATSPPEPCHNYPAAPRLRSAIVLPARSPHRGCRCTAAAVTDHPTPGPGGHWTRPTRPPPRQWACTPAEQLTATPVGVDASRTAHRHPGGRGRQPNRPPPPRWAWTPAEQTTATPVGVDAGRTAHRCPGGRGRRSSSPRGGPPMAARQSPPPRWALDPPEQLTATWRH